MLGKPSERSSSPPLNLQNLNEQSVVSDLSNPLKLVCGTSRDQMTDSALSNSHVIHNNALPLKTNNIT